MRTIKREIRILGLDDASFIPRTEGKVPIIGVVFRGGDFLDGIIKTEITIDGMDATNILEKAIKKSKHNDQLSVIMMKGVTMGGFNIVDIKKLYERTGIPVIVVSRKKPNLKKIEMALGNLPDFKKRRNCIKHAGKFFKLEIVKNKSIYFQLKGLTKEEAEKIIRLSCTRSLIPEPLRVAHLIASGIVKGESGGRA